MTHITLKHIETNEPIRRVAINELTWNAERISENMAFKSRLFHTGRKDFCCFGFVGYEMGYSLAQMANVTYLRALTKLGKMKQICPNEIIGLIEYNVEDIIDKKNMMEVLNSFYKPTIEGWITLIQDSNYISYEAKKQIIPVLFKEYYNIEIVFINNP